MNRFLTNYWRGILAGILTTTLIVGIGVSLFVRARDVMREHVRDMLKSTATAVAVGIDGDQLKGIQTPADMNKPEFRTVVSQLHRLTHEVDHIRFAYIMRKTSDPANLAFVLDADSLSTLQDLDLNHNGVIDTNEEPALPGELYDVSDNPILSVDAFDHPTADIQPSTDQWGPLISGYAPIRSRSTGKVAAIVGIDMSATDFQDITLSIFSPISFVLLISGGVLLAGVLLAIFERHRADMQQRISEERSGILKLTLHQLGEPLTIMKWGLEILTERDPKGDIEKEIPEHISLMQDGLSRLNSIIDTLQLAEKVEYKNLQYKPVESSLPKVIDDILEDMKARMKSAQLSTDLSVDSDLQFAFDPVLVDMVIRMLLENAVDYSGENEKIFIDAHRTGQEVTVSVRDHGCGIPDTDLPRMFERYVRATNATLRKPDGNGLGLYIVKGIIEKAGGRIRVESKVGLGSKFTFTLPWSPRL